MMLITENRAMKIYTSYFGNIRHLPKDMVLLSIAGKTPTFFLDAKYPNHYKFGKIAPLYEWWREWEDRFGSDRESYESISWYADKYFSTILNLLDPADVVKEIEAITRGKDACLLCYEKPDSFCHRILVAKWLTKNGFEVNEYPVS